MFDDLWRIGNYGANVLMGYHADDPASLRAMTKEEQDAYFRRLNEGMGNAIRSLEYMQGLQNARPTRQPTITLAEWDGARAVFEESRK